MWTIFITLSAATRHLFDSGTDAREGGYEAFDQKLSLLGALIEKVSDEKEIQKFTLKVS